MERDTEQIFIDFLLKENCYSQFVINLLEQKKLTIEEYISKMNTWYNIRFIVFDAFTWRYTAEEGEFWMDIDTKWQSLCTKLKICS